MATKKRGRQSYDWNLIMQDYISDPESTQKKMAEKYGVTLRLLEEHARTEHWLATKKEYQKKIAEKTAEKIAEKISDVRADALVRLSNVAESLLQTIERTTADSSQFNRYIVSENAPAPEGIGVVSVTYEKEFEKTDTKAIKDIAQSLKTISEVLGYMKPGEVAKLQLEREKFEWEKKRDAERNGQLDTNEQYGVVMMPAVKEEEE